MWLTDDEWFNFFTRVLFYLASSQPRAVTNVLHFKATVPVQ